MSFDQALYEISYSNIILYSSIIPSYNSDEKAEEEIKEKDPKHQEELNNIFNEQ